MLYQKDAYKPTNFSSKTVISIAKKYTFPDLPMLISSYLLVAKTEREVNSYFKIFKNHPSQASVRINIFVASFFLIKDTISLDSFLFFLCLFARQRARILIFIIFFYSSYFLFCLLLLRIHQGTQLSFIFVLQLSQDPQPMQ